MSLTKNTSYESALFGLWLNWVIAGGVLFIPNLVSVYAPPQLIPIITYALAGALFIYNKSSLRSRKAVCPLLPTIAMRHDNGDNKHHIPQGAHNVFLRPEHHKLGKAVCDIAYHITCGFCQHPLGESAGKEVQRMPHMFYHPRVQHRTWISRQTVRTGEPLPTPLPFSHSHSAYHCHMGLLYILLYKRQHS